MNAIARVKFWLGTFLTSVFIIASYELKATWSPAAGVPTVLLLILSFVLSSYLSTAFVSFMLSFQIGRKLIIRNTWLEGYWYLETEPNQLEMNQKDNHVITSIGLLYISYIGRDLDLSLTVYRQATKASGLPYFTTSEIAHLRESDMFYFNYFTTPAAKTDFTGVTVGKFIKDGPRWSPNIWQGKVITFNDGIYWRQVGQKIPMKKVRKFQKDHGEEWQNALIQEKREALTTTSSGVSVNDTTEHS